MALYNRDYVKSHQQEERYVRSEETAHSYELDRATFIKKTYQLFAASLMAATTGAYIGMGIAPAIASWYWGLVILEFAMLFGVYLTKSKPGINLAMLFGFTFLTGLTLTPLLSAVLGMPGGASIVTNALLLTGVAFGGISLFAINTTRDFSFMGKFLFIALIIIIVASLINIFLGSPLMQMVIASAGALLFSAFILFDTQNIIKGAFNTPVEAAIALYLDVLNLFISLLQILGIFGNEE
ncbi:Bax inhibitor-1/YccA family protein [Nitrosophilus alvini]|uniref:Bax inhibitor-1/YccA family protein n=1 Tax=Nitrosophilus alvini TaxID=2714855 RepID=UPI00190E06B2|nr:Bax inhibitor-1/YccA family protein [Nitrosophilus alvini]